jgi:hypothetical protein
VPSVELNDNGDTLLMGRSSNSSHYQLSADRLVSRIHVRARYIAAAAPLEPNRVEIVCSGWNGLSLHCQGRTWELAKGDTFTSETEGADIMIDVQGARVMVHWPRRSGEREALAELSDSSWDNSPRQKTAAGLGLQGSPLRRSRRIESPESPTPANHSGTGLGLSTGITTGLTTLVEESVEQLPTVEIYEDASAEEAEPTQKKTDDAAGQSFLTEVTNSFSSDLSEPQSEDDTENNPNEENDPIIMSFGPFGANLTNRMTAFPSFSPKLPGVARMPSASSAAQASLALGIVTESKEETTGIKAEDKDTTPTPTAPPLLPAHINKAAITNHVINQLAFSRLSSNPLSGILNNLPSEEKRDLTTEQLRVILDAVPCVGSIKREGKDAAGKLLESEYFYEPDKDDDPGRRAAVVDGLRKPSLRNCRKQHKVRTNPPTKYRLKVKFADAGHLPFVAILLEATAHSMITPSRWLTARCDDGCSQ